MVSAFIVLLLGALSIAPVLSTPNKAHALALAERGGCNQDNVLRALIDPRYSSSALIFCSTYISIPASTVTAATVRLPEKIVYELC